MIVFGSEILVKSDIFGFMKFIFWVAKIKGFFWVTKKGLRDFFGYAKKSSDFYG